MNLSKYIDKDISIKWFADNAINLFFGKRTIKVQLIVSDEVVLNIDLVV